MADKNKEVPKNTPPSVKVEGFVKVTIKGKTETLTMEEAEMLKNQLSSVLKERKEYITIPSCPQYYPWNQWGYKQPYYYDWSLVSGGAGSSSSGLSTTGYISPFSSKVESDSSVVMDFNVGDSLKAGNYTFTFLGDTKA